MIRSTALLLAFAAAALGADRCAAGTLDGTAAGCLAADDANLDRVPDCMRIGRHVRVGSSISRGTAALHDGLAPTGLAGEPAGSGGGHMRVRGGALGTFWSGVFSR